MRDTCVLYACIVLVKQVTIIGRHEYIISLRGSRALNTALTYDDTNDKVRHRRVDDKGRHRYIFKMLSL